MGALISELVSGEKKLAKRQKAEKETEEKRPRRMGKLKYDPGREGVLLTEELPANLRSLPAVPPRGGCRPRLPAAVPVGPEVLERLQLLQQPIPPRPGLDDLILELQHAPFGARLALLRLQQVVPPAPERALRAAAHALRDQLERESALYYDKLLKLERISQSEITQLHDTIAVLRDRLEAKDDA